MLRTMVLILSVITLTLVISLGLYEFYPKGTNYELILVECPACKEFQGSLPFVAETEDKWRLPKKVEMLCRECKYSDVQGSENE